ncbi:hypothetical protein, partial [Laedolimicola sp.]|uniref:hypothetical protein n=1 Tax=Laedolimicola sp. TaxID=2981663 RepID=UPI003F7D45C1
GSNTAKAHLIFVQNIDFLCVISGSLPSRCHSLSGRCLMVCNVSTGGSGQIFGTLKTLYFPGSMTITPPYRHRQNDGTRMAAGSQSFVFSGIMKTV